MKKENENRKPVTYKFFEPNEDGELNGFLLQESLKNKAPEPAINSQVTTNNPNSEIETQIGNQKEIKNSNYFESPSIISQAVKAITSRFTIFKDLIPLPHMQEYKPINTKDGSINTLANEKTPLINNNSK